MPRGHVVTIETAATRFVDNLHPDLFSLSPKLAHSRPGDDTPAERELHDRNNDDTPVPRFLDSGIDVSDASELLRHLFRNHPILCQDAADADDDGRLGINDPIQILSFLFSENWRAPGLGKGPVLDVTLDDLSCEDGGVDEQP